ncbi:MAG: methyltransferase domain-containing protein [Lachnospiraceae bacterium]|nr:methyltransferase domain-containing protein [Lachnospiraceae bacterium]
MSELNLISFEEESPEIKDRVEKYWTKRASTFFEQRRAEIESDKANIWVEGILSHIPEDKGIKILDVGCGAGFFPVILGRLGYDVTGIDLTEEMICYADKMLDLYNIDRTRVRVMQGDAEAPAFPDDSFDVIVTRNLTWTLPHPIEAYKQWGRILKKGGILLNFDAEYAKGIHSGTGHKYDSLNNPAHAMIGKELNEECHKIYHMLTISSLDRPEWDVEVLTNVGFKEIELDKCFYVKAFSTCDRFYIPNHLFMIKAKKQ